MTALIIILYFADIASSLSSTFVALGSITLIVTVIGKVITTFLDLDDYMPGDSAKHKYEDLEGGVLQYAVEKQKEIKAQVSKFLSVGILFVFLSIVIPSKDFLYIAVGLKASEAVVTSETAKKSFALLENKLDRMLDEANVVIDEVKDVTEK